ncbi:hypothetical protein [Streptomyces fagopyri]|uniref:hypothetical protein n=1 Tax=Streptomyces fagopyri TaxID=2662397 RepID=UPI0038243280
MSQPDCLTMTPDELAIELLTTGQAMTGGRPEAERLLQQIKDAHAHTRAEDLRQEAATGDKSGLTRIYYRAAADYFDPKAPENPLTVLRAVEDTPRYRPVPGCAHCPDGHTPPDHGQAWGAFVGPERDGDGQPLQIIVARSAGAHVAESDAHWIRARLNDTADQA